METLKVSESDAEFYFGWILFKISSISRSISSMRRRLAAMIFYSLL
jgi:hypothetical protein